MYEVLLIIISPESYIEKTISLCSFDGDTLTTYNSSLRFVGFRLPSIVTLSCTAKEYVVNPIITKLKILKIINF
jgi:hypothetical protein